MTSSSIQDISGLLYQKQVNGQKNTSSDENDISGMFQNAMNLAKDNSTLGSSDYGKTKDLSVEKQQGIQSLHTMVPGTQKTYDYINRKDAEPAMEKSQRDSYGNVDRSKELRDSDVDRATKKDDAVNDASEVKKTDENMVDEKITDEKIVEKIAEELNVSEEDVKAAMEALGLSFADLTNQSNMALLVTQLTADGDSLAMLTDENMFASIKELTETISDMLQAETLSGLENDNGLNKEVVEIASEDDMLSAAMEDTVENVAEHPAGHTDATEKLVLEKTVDYEIHQEESLTENVELSGKDLQSGNDDADSGFSDTNPDLPEHSKNQTVTGQSDASALINPFDTSNARGMDAVNETDLHFSSNVNTKDIIDQIAEHVKINRSADFSEVEISLHPASLGNVHLQISEKAGIITAVITTENETVRDALLVQAMVLKEELNEQGLKVESVEVTVASHEFEQNMQQDDGQESRQLYEEQVHKQTRRRIMISGLEEAQEMLQDETLSDADRLQIDMMAKNGSSMDVMA